MTKSIKVVALLTVLSLMAVGCKEADVEESKSDEQMSEVGIMYVVDGVRHQITLHGEEERKDFIQRLRSMESRSQEMGLYDSDRVAQCVGTDDAAKEDAILVLIDKMYGNGFNVRIYAKEEADAFEWTDKMYDSGFNVRMSFDEEKNLFVCMAWK